jgi:hypothetical protein
MEQHSGTLHRIPGRVPSGPIVMAQKPVHRNSDVQNLDQCPRDGSASRWEALSASRQRFGVGGLLGALSGTTSPSSRRRRRASRWFSWTRVRMTECSTFVLSFSSRALGADGQVPHRRRHEKASLECSTERRPSRTPWPGHFDLAARSVPWFLYCPATRQRRTVAMRAVLPSWIRSHTPSSLVWRRPIATWRPRPKWRTLGSGGPSASASLPARTAWSLTAQKRSLDPHHRIRVRCPS